MTRLWRWLTAYRAPSTQMLAEAMAVFFVSLGVLRLPWGAGEAQVLVLAGLVWATLALVRAAGDPTDAGAETVITAEAPDLARACEDAERAWRENAWRE